MEPLRHDRVKPVCVWPSTPTCDYCNHIGAPRGGRGCRLESVVPATPVGHEGCALELPAWDPGLRPPTRQGLPLDPRYAKSTMDSKTCLVEFEPSLPESER